MKQTKLSFNFFRQVYRHVRPFRWRFLGALALIAVQQAVSTIFPLAYGKVVDSIFAVAPFSMALVWILAALGLLLLGSLVGYARDRYEIRYLDYNVEQHVTARSFTKFLSLSIGQNTNHHSGIKHSVISRGTHSLTTFIDTLLYTILPDLARIVFVLVFILFLEVRIGLVMLAGVLMFIFVSIKVNQRFRPQVKKMQNLWDENSKIETELVRNAELIQSNGQENRAISEVRESYETIKKYGIDLWTRFWRTSRVRDLISIVTRTAVMILGVWYVLKGYLTPGYIVVLLSWSSDAFSRLSNIGFLHRRLLDTGTSVQKLFEFFEISPSVISSQNPNDISALEGSVQFKGVSFSYPKRRYLESDDEDNTNFSEWNDNKMKDKQDKTALHKISFSVPAGTRAAIVGSSGAGKSTIVHLLLRAYDPDKGHITIDGVDIRDMNLSAYRRQVGIVEQQVALFDNTLRYNICFGRNADEEVLSDEELRRIACMSRIDGFMHKLEKGFDTIIGEKGIKLSGGERQRVGIARALAKNPRILIFDEATSNLDTENEHLIQESMREASQGRTTIVIAHRLSTVQDADQIVVLNEGVVVGIGTHKELLRSCGQYKTLVKHQMNG